MDKEISKIYWKLYDEGFEFNIQQMLKLFMIYYVTSREINNTEFTQTFIEVYN